VKRSALLRKTPLGRGSSSLKRSWLRPRRKPVGVIVADIWREDLGPCVACTPGRQLRGRIDGHHVIPKSVLIRRGFRAFVMDKRNRIALCRTHHSNHHSRSQPIPRELLPEAAFRFADELGLRWYLERHYPASTEAAA
jgi:hypothetical protein